jgi:hypothetical protein
MLISLPIFWHKPFTYVSTYTSTCVCELFLGKNFWCIFSSENFGKICFSSTILTKFSVLLGKSLPIFFWPHQIEKKEVPVHVCIGVCVCVCVCAHVFWKKILLARSQIFPITSSFDLANTALCFSLACYPHLHIIYAPSKVMNSIPY